MNPFHATGGALLVLALSGSAAAQTKSPVVPSPTPAHVHAPQPAAHAGAGTANVTATHAPTVLLSGGAPPPHTASLPSAIVLHPSTTAAPPKTTLPAQASATHQPSETLIVAGHAAVVGAHPPSTGTYLNRASVEGSLEQRAKGIQTDKQRLSHMEAALRDAKNDAAAQKTKSADIRTAAESHAFDMSAGGKIRLSRSSEGTYHAAGQAEYRANVKVQDLERGVSELKTKIASTTQSYEKDRAELAQHPDVQWFKL
jgi:hypothetical protein